jgi:DNA-binding CsgD family transcriptional regulator/PAS domain-containing protein
MRVLAAETVSDLVGSIYDCALDPDRWTATLAGLRTALGFAQATLSLQARPSGRVLLNVADGIPVEWLVRVPDYGADIVELWGGPATIENAPLEEPLLLSDANRAVADGTSANRFHVEWHGPQSLIDTMTIGLARDDDSFATASFVRHADQGPIGAEERFAARLFAPHLRRAVVISRLLDAERLAAATFAATLEAANVPILIIDSAMRLLHANVAARSLLDAGDVLSLRGGRVRIEDLLAESALTAALMASPGEQDAIGRRGLGVPFRDSRGAAGAIHLLPLAHGTLRSTLVPGAAAALFVSSAEARRGDVGAVIAPLFDLTPAEVRVFDLIGSGQSVKEAAASLRISVGTLRTHLARVFEKTGTSRQSALVRMAASLSLPV